MSGRLMTTSCPFFGYHESSSRGFYPSGKRLIIDFNQETDMTILQLEGEDKKYKIERYGSLTVEDSIAHNFGRTHSPSRCIFCRVKELENESNALKSLVE